MEITINPYARSDEHLIVDLFTHDSELSEFIQSDAPSDTLLLISNEFGTVFELGIQRLETLEQLEIQYSQALAKPVSNILISIYRDSHRASLFLTTTVSLSLQSAL